MYSYWSTTQPNNNGQPPFQQGFFQSQQTFPCMWQQQQQGQFMSSNGFNIPWNGGYTYTEVNNTPTGQNNPSENKGENQKMNYEQNSNHGQQASHPENVIYRHASGPGWQQQQMFYPANAFK